MNDADLKRHLKDLAHGHHHPEEHDWDQGQRAPSRNAAAPTTTAKRRAPRKTAKRKTQSRGA